MESIRPQLSRAQLSAARGEARHRRRGPDLWTRLPLYAGAVAWTVSVVAVLFASRAIPKRYGLDRFFGVQRSMEIDERLLNTAMGLLLATCVLCAIGLVVNARRMKRRGDRYNPSLVFLGLASLVGVTARWLL